MLRIKGLTKRYRTGDLALKGIDLDVPDGEAAPWRDMTRPTLDDAR
jgi:hypothetical protein